MSYRGRKRSFSANDNNYNNHKRRKYNDYNDYSTETDEYVDMLPLIKCNKPRSWTVSIAIAGSVMDTASTPQLQAYLASQFARIISIFCIDEVIVFSEDGQTIEEEEFRSDPNLFMLRLLKYLETPQYLRRILFPVHCDFRYVGMCKPLRTPHHCARNELSPYREGVVQRKSIIHPKNPKKKITNHKNKNKKKQKLPRLIQNYIENTTTDKNYVSLVNIGLNKHCVIDKKLDQDTRITVKIDDYNDMYKVLDRDGFNQESKYYFGTVVEPTEPMRKDGIYWGYDTRFATNLSEVITGCSFDDEQGYDHIIGTSDKGRSIYDTDENNKKFKIPKFKHLLIVFGGPNGLESCQLDEGNKLSKPKLLFDQYINVCPFQGTRTIRSEEALLMTLSVLQPYLQNNYKS